QRAHDRANVVLRVEVDLRQLVDGSLVWGIRDKVLVQAHGHELGRAGLAHQDVDDVGAVEVATLAEEDLLAIVMQVGAELELPVESAIGLGSWNRVLQGPTSE